MKFRKISATALMIISLSGIGYTFKANAEQGAIDLGDLNGDGLVDAVDASAVLSAYADISTGKTPELSAEQLKAADVNADNIVDAVDASNILSYYAYVATGGKADFANYLDFDAKTIELETGESVSAEYVYLKLLDKGFITEADFETGNDNKGIFGSFVICANAAADFDIHDTEKLKITYSDGSETKSFLEAGNYDESIIVYSDEAEQSYNFKVEFKVISKAVSDTTETTTATTVNGEGSTTTTKAQTQPPTQPPVTEPPYDPYHGIAHTAQEKAWYDYAADIVSAYRGYDRDDDRVIANAGSYVTFCKRYGEDNVMIGDPAERWGESSGMWGVCYLAGYDDETGEEIWKWR